ncbi:nucleotide exchange factor GrpE [Sedimentibacter sp. LTW-03]
MAKAKKHDEEKLKEEELKLKEEEKEMDASKESNKKVQQDNSKENEADKSEDTKEQDDLQMEINSLNDRLLRLQADFLNYKTRTEKERVSAYGNAISDFMLDLLPVIDNFDRALASDCGDSTSYKEGIQMVYTQLMGILDKKSLKEIDALNKPFDHNFHYGVGFEASDEHEDGTVIDVLQKGYTVNDKCIRPAMVRICRK